MDLHSEQQQEIMEILSEEKKMMETSLSSNEIRQEAKGSVSARKPRYYCTSTPVHGR
jgi:hypothetical protein